jgi:hypothetical protein
MSPHAGRHRRDDLDQGRQGKELPPMADDAQTQTIRAINWREVFPFTHLFRAFRIAVHPSKLLLALSALLLIYLGGRVLDGAWQDKYKPHGLVELYSYAEAMRTHGENPFDKNAMARMPAATRTGIFITFFEYQVGQVNRIIGNAVGLNWYDAFDGVWSFLFRGPSWLFRYHPLYAVLFTAWFLLIWSIFGGAISRIAAVHVARDEKISVRQALRFSISKVLSFLFAPLIPLLIILVIGVIVAAVGVVLTYFKVVGPIIMGAIFFLALLAGFIMTLVALGTIGGFNLMFPTVAVEGSDSFDAISRSFSYVFARPWRMLWYTLLALIYGGIAYLFVRFFIFMMLSLTHFFVGWWLGSGARQYWDVPATSIWPPPTWDSLTYNVNYGNLKWSEDTAAGLISFWVYLTIGLLGAFAISFYFSANTIIYYLMRREVDATELDDVYVEESEDEFGEPVPSPAAGPTTAAVTTTTTTTVVSEGPAGGARAYGGPEGETRPTGGDASGGTGGGAPPGGAPVT